MNLLAQANEIANELAEAVRNVQQEANLPWYERLLDKYGLAMVVVMGLGWVCWKYGPRIIDAALEHLNNVNRGLQAVAKSAEENTAATQEMKATMSTMGTHIAHKMDPKGDPAFNNHIFSNVNTNAALLSFSMAIKAGCGSMPETERRDVFRHLDEVERLLRKS